MTDGFDPDARLDLERDYRVTLHRLIRQYDVLDACLEQLAHYGNSYKYAAPDNLDMVLSPGRFIHAAMLHAKRALEKVERIEMDLATPTDEVLDDEEARRIEMAVGVMRADLKGILAFAETGVYSPPFRDSGPMTTTILAASIVRYAQDALKRSERVQTIGSDELETVSEYLARTGKATATEDTESTAAATFWTRIASGVQKALGLKQ